jgi:hypothetical protein
MSDEDVARELDARHAAARRAFEARDIDAYRAVFSPSLAYRQPDRKVVGRDALMRDVAQQFRNLGRASSTYTRERLIVTADEAIETLIQTAMVEATMFGVLHRGWRLTRRGDYAWCRKNGGWTIARVDVFSESLTHTGWRLGLR